MLVLTVALLLRLATAIYLGNTVSGLSGAQDEISYSMLGQRFASGHGMTFPSEWYPWIKPDAPQSYYSFTMSFFLAAIYKLFGYLPLAARLITGLLSVVIVWLIYRIAQMLFNDAVALISAVIAAVYAYLIFYGVTLVTETPFILALLTSIYISLKIVQRPTIGRWVVLGIALAITVLLRMAVIVFVPFLLGWLVWTLGRKQILGALIPVALIVVSILPFSIHNYGLWGRFLLLEAQFGHVFWNGNHPDQAGDFHPYEVFPIPSEVLALDNDAAITNRLLVMGMQNVLHDPGHFLKLTVTRLREFFTFWPTPDSTLLANAMRVFSFGIIVPFAVVGLIANLSRWRVLLPVFLFMLIHTAVYAISWTMIRYRLPLDVFLIMFAAYTFYRIGVFVQGRKPEPLLTRSLYDNPSRVNQNGHAIDTQ